MINAINCNVLTVWKEKDIWELDFETSSDSEDNDSDDEENETRAKQLRNIHEAELEELKNPSKNGKNQMSKFIERLKLKVIVSDNKRELRVEKPDEKKLQ